MTDDDALPPAPPLRALLEAALYTTDLTTAATFYGEVLGLEEVARVEGRHIFYRVGAIILLIFDPASTRIPSDNRDLPVPTHGAEGAGHLCFAASTEQITTWTRRLAAAGHPIEKDFTWPNGARSIYFRDPAGNSLEMAEPWLWD